MKLLLKLSLATALFSSALGALSLNEFITNSKVLALAPHLVQEISTQGIEFFNSMDIPPITAGLKVPLLDDIVQIVSLNIFNGKGADWSRLEAAKLKAIKENSAEAFKAAADLTDVDTRQASLITNAIYDTVIAIPATTKETYNARTQAQAQAKVSEETAETTETKPEAKPEAEAPKKDIVSNIWDVLGFSLMKSQDTVRMAKAMIGSSNVCETTDTAYLKGVEEIVYYSSLTHGLAGGALAIAPQDSPPKSLDLKTIISSVGKLAVEIQMAQSVARLAGLNPADPLVRAITFLSLSADSPSAQDAQTARDLHNLINNGVAELIPESVILALSDQAALTLITRGAGQSSVGSAFEAVPVLRNVFAFSNEVLNANNIGDVVKFVFCPQSSRVEPAEPEEAKKVVEEVKQGIDAVQDKTEKEVKEAAEKVVEEVKQGADAVQDKTEKEVKEAAEKVVEEVKQGADDVQDKTEKEVKEAAEKAAAMKKAAEDKAAEMQKAAEEKVTETKEAAADVVEKVVVEGEKVAEEASKQPQERPKKEDAKEEL